MVPGFLVHSAKATPLGCGHVTVEKTTLVNPMPRMRNAWQLAQKKASPPPAKPAPTPEPPLDIPAALALINGSDVARDVAIIPTIGQGAAKVLIENRPDGGYASLDEAWELNPVLFEGRYKIDVAIVAAWGG